MTHRSQDILKTCDEITLNKRKRNKGQDPEVLALSKRVKRYAVIDTGCTLKIKSGRITDS